MILKDEKIRSKLSLMAVNYAKNYHNWDEIIEAEERAYVSI